jgi:molybdopterin-guanine dinucleotide biosynthesis protein A
VVACDLVAPSAEAMAATVVVLAAEPDHDLAVPHDGDGVPQWLHAAWRRSAWERLQGQLRAGERSIHRAVAAERLRAVTVSGLPAAGLTDADVPGQLPRPAD